MQTDDPHFIATFHINDKNHLLSSYDALTKERMQDYT